MHPLYKKAAFLLFALSLCLGPQALPASTEIRVIAWNIEWFPGQQFSGATPEAQAQHIEIAQHEFRKMNADILLASEIRDWRSFSTLVSVDPDITVANVSHFVDRDEGVLWRQQLAIGSRLPIVAAFAEPFRPTMTSLVRGFSFAAIALPLSDDVVLFYAVHLKSNRSWNEQQAAVNFRIRDESIVQILQHVDQMERLMWKGRVAGVVIGGDINTNEDGQFGDNVVQMLIDAGFRNTWANVPQKKRLTWRGSEQFTPTTFDYIFVRGDRLQHSDAFMIEVPAEASDHHAVVLDLIVTD